MKKIMLVVLVMVMFLTTSGWAQKEDINKPVGEVEQFNNLYSIHKKGKLSDSLLADVEAGDMKSLNTSIQVMDDAFKKGFYVISGYTATVVYLVAAYTAQMGRKIITPEQDERIRKVKKESEAKIVMKNAWMKLIRDTL